jgi:hypothetical protein
MLLPRQLGLVFMPLALDLAQSAKMARVSVDFSLPRERKTHTSGISGLGASFVK